MVFFYPLLYNEGWPIGDGVVINIEASNSPLRPALAGHLPL